MAITINAGEGMRRAGAIRALVIIVAINAMIYIALRFAAGFAPDTAENIISALSLPSGGAALTGRPWSLLTYMVAQYDALHVILNMLWFTWFGLILVDAGVRARFIALTYISGGLGAALAYILISPGEGAFLIGSSGAVMAIVAAAAVASPKTRLDLPLMRSISVATAAIIIAAIYAAGIALGSGGSHIAHIAGGAAGVAAALIFRRGLSANATPPRLAEDASGPILDKVRTSGFDALTADERLRLINASLPHRDK